jgi:tetratricopeptide (TPR) repeat protein
MALDQYSPCPCGSGKKFKWCCLPIHEKIAKAYDHHANGQHDVALRTIDEVAAEHPGNPEVWGRKAQLLYEMGKPDEAEEALNKAFAINANYPFGFLLKGQFRQSEGELAGALILFRKAAEVYDPEARALLAGLQMMIAECELQLNRPVAARAAFEIARRLKPEDPEFGQQLQGFDQTDQLPRAARREYKFQNPAASASAERRSAWDKALAGAATGRLSDAARAFWQLTCEDGEDAAAWYNLALSRAWLGDNPGAIDAFDRYVNLEADETKAAEAWALTEALRLGQGMEDQADYVGNAIVANLRDPQQFVNALQQLQSEKRLIAAQVDQETQVLSGIILEKVQALTPELEASVPARMGAALLVRGNLVRLANVNLESLDKIFEELHQRMGPALNAAEIRRSRTPCVFTQVLSGGVAFPTRAVDEDSAKRQMDEAFAKYVEDVWIHRPLKSLNGVPPVDAGGHPVLRKKLRGAVQFLQECAEIQKATYDFNRLRRKLGLATGEPAVAAGAAPADISALGAAELAGLTVDSLSDAQAEQAYQTAVRLDAKDLAGKFAEALVRRPPRADKPDRFPWFSHLVQLSLAQNDSQGALDYLNEGEKDDCEHNEGRRRNDYELRRGQLLARRGDFDQAQTAFEQLIERAPAELRYRSTAAETMLSARQAARARRFAEEGLAQARKQNNRDSEEHFKELLGAAQRTGG